MEVDVKLTAMEWHQLLKVLETELGVVNSQRFTGVPNEQLGRLYNKIATQLHGVEVDNESG